MVRLATVRSTFHARVIAARLGAEGMVTELRGNLDGPYPMGDVHVYVGEDDLAAASELMLADEVESAFDDSEDPDEAPSGREFWLAMAGLLAVAAMVFARTF
jgi:hypothetical protein